MALVVVLFEAVSGEEKQLSDEGGFLAGEVLRHAGGGCLGTCFADLINLKTRFGE